MKLPSESVRLVKVGASFSLTDLKKTGTAIQNEISSRKHTSVDKELSVKYGRRIFYLLLFGLQF